jgi:hypothetical protein
MIEGKYGAVIGWRIHICVRPQSRFPGYGVSLANHSAVFPVDHQNTYGISPNDSVNDSG